jgi:hypothetical protein
MKISAQNKLFALFRQFEKLLILLSFIMAFSTEVVAQLYIGDKDVSNYYPDSQRPGFYSVFKDLKDGDFPGTLSGTLFLQKNGAKGVAGYNFLDEKAELHIEYDPDSVYDVSRKHHQFKRQDIQLRYTTYYWANCFEAIIGKDTVCVNMIDGGCDVVIDGLEHTYSADKESERLYLYASKDLGLWKRRTRISSYVIKKGSLLCFDISRTRKKKAAATITVQE